MSTRRRAALYSILGLGFAATILLLPLFPWSAHWRHSLNRIVVKTEIELARIRGSAPRLAGMTGTVNISGAEVEALDSRSGIASISDADGRFTLPGIMWYPGASYDLIISTDEQEGVSLKVRAPDELPTNSEFSVGALNAQAGRPVKLAHLPGRNSITYKHYDWPNDEYYRDTFARLTTGQRGDAARVSALNNYVATRLNYGETEWELDSPRRVLERGSQFCGHLAETMATLLMAGDYEARIVNLCDTGDNPNTHVVVEVQYGDGWHLYDPTFGVSFKDPGGNVVSYSDLRRDQSFITNDLFDADSRKPSPALPEWMPDAYRSGYHHFYSIQK